MIRGVSRYTVEVNQTGSPYFERAICFVRPEFAQCDRLDLHRAAKQLVSALDGSVEEERAEDGAPPSTPPEATGLLARLEALPRWVAPTASAIGGAGAALLGMLAFL